MILKSDFILSKHILSTSTLPMSCKRPWSYVQYNYFKCCEPSLSFVSHHRYNILINICLTEYTHWIKEIQSCVFIIYFKQTVKSIFASLSARSWALSLWTLSLWTAVAVAINRHSADFIYNSFDILSHGLWWSRGVAPHFTTNHIFVRFENMNREN